MKKKIKKIGGGYSRNERKALLKNKEELKALRIKINIILLAMPAVGKLQGKLGFSIAKRDGDFLLNAKTILEALTLNTGSYFTPPFNDMALLSDLIDAFDTAMQNSKLKVIGSGAAKKVAKIELFNVLKSALEFVNKIARQLSTVAEEVITSAKMLIRGTATSKKPVMSAKNNGATLEVLLQCRAFKVDAKYYTASYNWQKSLDGGATWIDLPDSNKAKLVVKGLILNTVVKFRKRTFTEKEGLTAWCAAVDYSVI